MKAAGRGEYERRIIEAEMPDGSTRKAWCYFYLDPTDDLEEIADGDWGAHCRDLLDRQES